MDASSITPNATPGKKEPEKYIRTFAGDMEILKKGGTPDLTPLSPNAAPLPQTLIPKSFVPPPVVPPKPPPVDPLKTYSGDFTDRIKETHASTATILAAEQDSSRHISREETPEPSRMNLPFIIAGVIFLIVGAVGGYVAYTRYIATSAPIILAPTIPTPIFVDEREEVSGTGSAILQAIRGSVNRPLSAGTVRLLYVATTSADSVFSALAAVSAPDVLLRNVKAEGSMAGVIHIGGNQSPFFILSVLSYSNTFAGMLAWESIMPLYLADLYPPYPALQAPMIEVASTTTISTSSPQATTKKTTTKNTASSTTSTNSGQASSLQVIASPVPVPVIRFFDTTITNHDARVYRDTANRVVLVYGYWNSTTLVIARDAAAFTEILQRLATARTP